MHQILRNDISRGSRTPGDGTAIIRSTLCGGRLPFSALATPQILRAIAQHLAERHAITTDDLLTSRRGECCQLRAMIFTVAVETLGLARSAVRRYVATGHYLDNPEREHAHRRADPWYRIELHELERFVTENA